jgi:hypothetical protein
VVFCACEDEYRHRRPPYVCARKGPVTGTVGLPSLSPRQCPEPGGNLSGAGPPRARSPYGTVAAVFESLELRKHSRVGLAVLPGTERWARMPTAKAGQQGLVT